MRIKESHLRAIVKSILRESIEPGDLAPGVTPELFAEGFRKFWGVKKRMDPWYDEIRVSRLVEAGLSEEQAQGVLSVMRLCTEPTDPPYNFKTILDPMFMAVGHKENPKIKERLVASIELDLGHTNSYHNELAAFAVIAGIRSPTDQQSETSNQEIFRQILSLQSLSADTLERRINFMDSMYAFLEPKQIDRGIRQKLMALVREGVGGMMQAAELYRMMS